MTVYLRQSTASQQVLLGMFISSTDGVTPKTGLTIANTDIVLWKKGGTTIGTKNSGGATEISGGFYYAVFDATDTNTLGPMIVTVNVSGALMLRFEVAVLTAETFDAWFSTGKLATSADMKRALGLGQENFKISSPTFSGTKMTGCTVKIYPTNTDCTNDTNVLATYTITATYDGNGNLATYSSVQV